MHELTAPQPPAPHMLPASFLPEGREPDITRCALSTVSSNPAVKHDATLLVAALEDIEARRAAIEWLLDANLLCLCLV